MHLCSSFKEFLLHQFCILIEIFGILFAYLPENKSHQMIFFHFIDNSIVSLIILTEIDTSFGQENIQ